MLLLSLICLNSIDFFFLLQVCNVLFDLSVNISNSSVGIWCLRDSLFQIVTILLQPGLLFANRQQLGLSFLKATGQIIDYLKH